MNTAYHRIAVVPDPTAESQPAFKRAVRMARASGARLDLIGVVYDEHLAGERLGDSADLAAARQALIDGRRRWLDWLGDPVAEAGLEVHAHVAFAQPLHEAIMDAAAMIEPDLLVKDTHFHGPLSRTLFSNTDWELIRLCPFPLLLVKPREWSASARVLAAVDPLHEVDGTGELDHAILAAAQELVSIAAGELHVVHVCPEPLPPPIPGFIGPAVLDTDELARNIERAHCRAVDALLSDYAVHAEHIEVGSPSRRLVEIAGELEADVMIIGAVSRSGLRRRFIGHTARQVLDRLPCDLLIVKQPRASTL